MITCEKTFSRNKASVDSVICAEGFIVSCSRDNHIRVFTEDEGYRKEYKHVDPIYSLLHHKTKTGNLLISGDTRGCVLIHTFPDLVHKKTFSIDNGRRNTTVIHLIMNTQDEDSFLLVCSTGFKGGFFFRMNNFMKDDYSIEELFSNDHRQLFVCYQLLNNPQNVVVGGSVTSDKTMNLVNINTKNSKKFEPIHTNNISSFSSYITGAGKEVLMSGSRDKQVIFWDLDSLAPLKKYTLKHSIFSLLKITNEKYFIGGLGAMYFFNFEENEDIHVINESIVHLKRETRDIRFLQKDKIVTGCEDSFVKIWKVNDPVMCKIDAFHKYQYADARERYVFMMESFDQSEIKISISGINFFMPSSFLYN